METKEGFELHDLFSDDKNPAESIEETLNKIQSMVVTCPVNIFNLGDYELQQFLGTYLLTRKPHEIEALLNPLVKVKELTNDSVLFFSQRHLMEMMAVLYGMFAPVLATGQMAERQVLVRILELIQKIYMPIRYMDFREVIDRWLTSLRLTDSVGDEYIAYFKPILRHIWFIAYAGLDQIIQDAKKHFEEEANNSGEDSTAN